MSYNSNDLFVARNSRSGYEIEQSLRFDGTEYLERTFSSAGNRRSWTWSVWAKIADPNPTKHMNLSTCEFTNRTYYDIFGISLTSSEVFWSASSTSGTPYGFNSNDKMRDTSAWYHFVYVWDSANATADDRCVIYVNGVRASKRSGSNPTQNTDSLGIGEANKRWRIGADIGYDSTWRMRGYMAEVVFVDGQSLDPTDLGEYDENGVWRPIDPSGLTFGSNGYYLKFDPSATNGIGHDHSGNGNNFTPTAGFVTSGTGTDVMDDTPTTNWCTFNPVYVSQNNSGNQISEGNLKYVSSGLSWRTQVPTFGLISSGKWYWEWSVNTTDAYIGVVGENVNTVTSGNTQSQSGTILYYSGDGNKRIDNVASSYGSAYNGGGSDWSPTVGVALDKDNNTITFYRNGVSQGTINLSSSSVDLVNNPVRPAFLLYDGTSYGNFGQFSFQYTPPTGFKALNTTNLPAPDIADGSDYFQTVLYTGNDPTGQDITVADNSGNAWQPDFVWIKARGAAYWHRLYDAVRGATKELYSNEVNAEDTDANALTSFNSDGFTLGSDTGVNQNTYNFVSWNWKAGNGTSSNTDGSITSTVSANPSAGFSIVTYTGTNNNATVGHGLGVAPSLIIVKNRNTANHSWYTYHKDLGASYYIYLNLPNAAGTGAALWNGAPSSTVFTLGTSNGANQSGYTYVAYCFAEVEGYSKFGRYIGNGSSDGPFLYCGFRPAFWLVKCTTASEEWRIYDGSLNPYNTCDDILIPNAASSTQTTGAPVDLLSSGVKIRGTAGGNVINGSGQTYIFAAFAENPFGGDGVSPATAR